MENLEWFPVIGYEGLYEITKCGKVKSLARNRVGKNVRFYKEKNISIVNVSNGYKSVTLYKDSVKNKWLLHRLVATCFIKKPVDKDFVNHKDFNKSNNHVDNLEWVSSIENNCHMQSIRKNTSKYPGVYLYIDKKRYRSQINHNGIKVHFGIFNTEKEAYDARRKYEIDNNIKNKYI